MTDQIAGREIARHEITRQEIAGHENDGPKMTPGREIRGEKIVLTEITVQYEVCKFLNPQHCNTLCMRDYLFLKNVKSNAVKYVFCFSILHIIMKHKTQK